MVMTKKHFKAIAKIINEAIGENDSIYDLTQKLSYFFKEENTRFDKDTFMKACGL